MTNSDRKKYTREKIANTFNAILVTVCAINCLHQSLLGITENIAGTKKLSVPFGAN